VICAYAQNHPKSPLLTYLYYSRVGGKSQILVFIHRLFFFVVIHNKNTLGKVFLELFTGLVLISFLLLLEHYCTRFTKFWIYLRYLPITPSLLLYFLIFLRLQLIFSIFQHFQRLFCTFFPTKFFDSF
jgi:hypothetical protein